VFLGVEINDLLAIIEGLKKKIEALKKRLSKYENPKNSRDSSMPP
jgi:hypothetical protein